MTTVWDDVLGNITKKLKEKGMWENTLLIFTSDNGGPVYNTSLSFGKGGANNFPLKSGKMSTFEGGIRTLGAVGGGFLPNDVRGTTVEGYVHVCDFYATVCKLAGVDPEDHVEGMPDIDALDMWDMITGKNLTSPRTSIPIATPINAAEGISPLPVPNIPFIHDIKLAGAIIVGDYKFVHGIETFNMHFSHHYPNSTFQMGIELKDLYLAFCEEGCLYNIKEDPEEYHNLALTHPIKLAEMWEEYNKMLKGAWSHKSVEPESWNNQTMFD